METWRFRWQMLRLRFRFWCLDWRALGWRRMLQRGKFYRQSAEMGPATGGREFSDYLDREMKRGR